MELLTILDLMLITVQKILYLFRVVNKFIFERFVYRGSLFKSYYPLYIEGNIGQYSDSVNLVVTGSTNSGAFSGKELYISGEPTGFSYPLFIQNNKKMKISLLILYLLKVVIRKEKCRLLYFLKMRINYMNIIGQCLLLAEEVVWWN